MQNDTALAVAEHVLREWPGARVFPVHGKVPAFREVRNGWNIDATDDIKQAATWFTADPGYGLAVTGILAIDCDHPELLDAPDSINEGVFISGNPDRFTALFRQPDDPFGDGSHAAGQIKGSGYVCLPPSVHDSADCTECTKGEHRYVWMSGELDGLPTLPPDVEEWLVANGVRRQRERAEAGPVPGHLPELWLTLGEPCRTTGPYLRDLLAKLAEPGADKHPLMLDGVLQLLRFGEEGHGGVTWALGELWTQFHAACLAVSPARAAQARHEWQRALLGAIPLIDAKPTPGGKYGCCGPDEATLEGIWEATPALQHIKAWADGSESSPWALLGAGLARAVAEVSPAVRIPAFVRSPASLNLYVALVGGSGAGKSSAWTGSGEAVQYGVFHPRETVGAGTGEGFIASFMEKTPQADIDAAAMEGRVLPKFRVKEQSEPHVLAYIDEVAQWQAVSQRGGSSIDSILRSMWNAGEVGNNNANPDARRHLPHGTYRLGLVAGVQPELAGSMLDKMALASGTAQRWVWLPAKPTVPDDDYAPLPPKPAVRQWTNPGIPSDGLIVFPDHVGPEVVAGHRRAARTEDPKDAIAAHRMLTRLKVAAALALWHGSLEVDDLLWTVSGAIMDKSDATCAHVLAALEEARVKAAEGRGREDADRARGKASSDEAVVRNCAASIARTVRKHAVDGSPLHTAGKPCTPSCLAQAVAGKYRKLYLDDAKDYALAEDWVRVQGSVKLRYTAGDKGPE